VLTVSNITFFFFFEISAQEGDEGFELVTSASLGVSNITFHLNFIDKSNNT
jgi:hypothetical protein